MHLKKSKYTALATPSPLSSTVYMYMSWCDPLPLPKAFYTSPQRPSALTYTYWLKHSFFCVSNKKINNKVVLQVSQRFYRESVDSEQDVRIRQLTENLIHKQTIIEALHTDKQTLTLQLERLEVCLSFSPSLHQQYTTKITLLFVCNMTNACWAFYVNFFRKCTAKPKLPPCEEPRRRPLSTWAAMGRRVI